MINEISSESELFGILKAFAGGGTISIMRGVDKRKPDFKIISNLATLFAKDGHEVWILANVHFISLRMDYSIKTTGRFDPPCDATYRSTR